MQIFADYYNSVMLSNGNIRIQLVQQKQDDTVEEVGTLVIPASQIYNFVHGIIGSLKGIDEKLRKAQEEKEGKEEIQTQ